MRANTTQPWNDEAWYTAPSRNFVLHGHTGTPYLETVHKFWRGIDKRTYWVAPLQFFIQIPWIALFGFSLLTMRLYAIAWGLIALLSWGFSTLKLTGDRTVSLLTMAFIACDYQFDSQVSLARMDAMSLGLASLAIAVYLGLRQRHLGWAIACSQLAVMACGLTHPTPGVPAFIAVSVLTLYLDRHRLRWVHLFSAAAPYLLGLIVWGWYISYSPELFRAQFLGNVTDMDRLGGLTHPFRAILREFGRYAGMAGFAQGMNSLYRIKLLAICAYAAAVIGVAASRQLRTKAGVRTLLVLWATYFLVLMFYDNTKEVKYAIHIVTIYDALLAVFVGSLLTAGRWQKSIAIMITSLFVIVNVGGLFYVSIAKDDYHKAYLPTAEFLNNKGVDRNALILAGSEFGFALGFDRNVVDDNDFLYYSHRQPEYIVMSNGYRASLNHASQTHPEIFRYFTELITNRYHKVFERGEYEVYQRNAVG